MAIMVTGTGFVGGYIVRDLLRAGEDVVLYGLLGGTPDGSSTPRDIAYLDEIMAGEQAAGRMIVVPGDVCDLDLIRRTLQAHDVTAIAHLASLISVSSQQNVPRAVDVNIQGTLNIFEAALEYGVERVVWTSSINVFGPRSVLPDGTISDDSPVDPQSVYATCKATLESLARNYHDDRGLNVVGLRLSRVYGFGEHVKAGRGSGSSWVANLLEFPATGRPSVVPFGERNIDLQYVEDASAAFLAALESRAGGGGSYLTHGDYRPVAEIFEYVRSLLPDEDMTLVSGTGGAPLPTGSQTNWEYRFDSSRAERELGIRSQFTIEEGFRRTVQQYRDKAGLPPIAGG